MNKITTLLKGSRCPLIIYMNKRETASVESVETNVFQDKTNGFSLVTNVTAPKSIVGGTDNPVKIGGISEQIDVASFLASEEISHMVDSEGNHVYMDVELAFDLAGESIHSMLTGNVVTIAYADDADEGESEDDSDEEEIEIDMSEDSEDDSSDESEDGEEDDSSEDMGEDVDDTEVMEDSDDEVDIDMTEEDVSEDDSSEEDSDSEELTEDGEEMAENDVEEDMSSEDDSADDSEDMSEEEEPSVEAVAEEDIEVSMLDMVDASKTIRLVATASDSSEIAAFVGGIPVGKLALADASETASFLYSDSKKLFLTFKDRFLHAAKTGNYDELASLGFSPYTAKTKVSALVGKYIEQETASVHSEIAAERGVGIERHKKVVNLAMVGILKGLYDKSNNPLVKEVSSLLRQSGHQAPEQTARRALVNAAGEFAKAVFARADELAKESDSYLNGIADTVASADFKSSDSETVDPGRVTTLFGGPKREMASEEGFVDQTTSTNKIAGKYDKIVAGLGRRF